MRQLDERLSCLSGRNLVVATVYGEARGESLEGQVAVAWTIQNRLKTGRWGQTYHEVLGAWAQFSALWSTLGGSNYHSVFDFATVLHNGEELQGAESGLQRQIEWVVDGVLEGWVLDNTFGSTHYFATWLKSPPFWAKAPGVRMATIGRHEFWAGVR